MAPSAALILAAGGSGSRLGENPKKQFAHLAGTPVLLRAIRPFASVPAVSAAVVVLPREDLPVGAAILGSVDDRLAIRCVAGGPTRTASVRLGLEHLPACDAVLVHDAARPFVSREVIERVLATALAGEAAVPALPVADTLKRVSAGRPLTVPREDLYGVQTPQAFPRDMLLEAHRRAAAEGLECTDDAGLCERYGMEVRLVEGEASNVKITRASDWPLAEMLAAALDADGDQTVLGRASGVARVGIGYDVHRLELGRPCVIGGVSIPSDRGPIGHSDGDVLLHAVMDALLGAAGEADIGHLFPPTDPRWAGADSIHLLKRVRARVAPLCEVDFVDAVLVAEAPRIGPHVPAMRERIARALGIAPGAVNVKATTAEGMGAIGRGEGISAQAVVTVRTRG
ncbi:MAG: 2-C-methyl-D-erythritol 4-phosphate cytidylyltransferase [Gemmatimonadetes bacterium]|nr:2-C-methyl-D-erythritol 4-phosphate cytidylyltransferase [Gemmatimonadota bacterium]